MTYFGNINVGFGTFHKPATIQLSAEENRELFANIFGEDDRRLYVDELPEDAKSGNVMYSDGVYSIFTNTIGRFVTKDKKAGGTFPYLKNAGKPQFRMDLPKIPKRYLTSMYDFFKKIAETNRNEVMVQIFWNFQKQEYEMHVPEQIVAGASISFDRTKGPMADDNLLWVMDVHSHVYMANFFSGTDSADEISARIFGVIGKLNQEGLHMSVRAGRGGEFIDLKVEDVFDMTDEGVYTVPKSDYAKVTERSSILGTHTNGILGSNTKYIPPVTKNTTHRSWDDWNKLGVTGFKQGYTSGYSLENRVEGYTEKDIAATDELELCRVLGNLLRARYMLSAEDAVSLYDSETQVSLLLASRFLIDFYNSKEDFRSVAKQAIETVYHQVCVRGKEIPEGLYYSTMLEVVEGLQEGINSFADELKAAAATENTVVAKISK